MCNSPTTPQWEDREKQKNTTVWTLPIHKVSTDLMSIHLQTIPYPFWTVLGVTNRMKLSCTVRNRLLCYTLIQLLLLTFGNTTQPQTRTSLSAYLTYTTPLGYLTAQIQSKHLLKFTHLGQTPLRCVHWSTVPTLQHTPCVYAHKHVLHAVRSILHILLDLLILLG